MNCRYDNKKVHGPNAPLLFPDLLLVLDRLVNVNVGILDVVGGGSDLVLDLVQKLTLLLSQEGKVEEHLMQLCNALLERQHVLILAGYICICRPVMVKLMSRSS